MTSIKFTASILYRGQGSYYKRAGSYVARADELSIKGEPATTQRGALKKLKDAVSDHWRKAADDGDLTTLLRDAGYPSIIIGSPDVTLEAHVFNTDTVSVRLPLKGKPSAKHPKT